MGFALPPLICGSLCAERCIGSQLQKNVNLVAMVTHWTIFLNSSD